MILYDGRGFAPVKQGISLFLQEMPVFHTSTDHKFVMRKRQRGNGAQYESKRMGPPK